MDLIKEIFDNVKTIAVIGMKDKAGDAYGVPVYLDSIGYKIYPVNPSRIGKKVLGEPFVGKITDIKAEIDLVNIFRRPEFIPEHVKEILSMKPLPKYVWFQLGIENDEAAAELEKAGIKVVQNSCMLVEHKTLKFR
ncbi:MAG: CoA-binding protein [Ignavibacteriae bacterium]|nr:MAG: CoA-binding protein [Ignavibacteriota bacterium]